MGGETTVYTYTTHISLLRYMQKGCFEVCFGFKTNTKDLVSGKEISNQVDLQFLTFFRSNSAVDLNKPI